MPVDACPNHQNDYVDVVELEGFGIQKSVAKVFINTKLELLAC